MDMKTKAICTKCGHIWKTKIGFKHNCPECLLHECLNAGLSIADVLELIRTFIPRERQLVAKQKATARRNRRIVGK